MTKYQGTPGYVTRTLQGLDKPGGGFAQPITLKRAMETGWNLELLIGVEPEIWTPILHIGIKSEDPVLIETDAGIFGTKYVNAIRARVRKEDHGKGLQRA